MLILCRTDTINVRQYSLLFRGRDETLMTISSDSAFRMKCNLVRNKIAIGIQSNRDKLEK